jgi:hypothetical protein
MQIVTKLGEISATLRNSKYHEKDVWALNFWVALGTIEGLHVSLQLQLLKLNLCLLPNKESQIEAQNMSDQWNKKTLLTDNKSYQNAFESMEKTVRRYQLKQVREKLKWRCWASGSYHDWSMSGRYPDDREDGSRICSATFHGSEYYEVEGQEIYALGEVIGTQEKTIQCETNSHWVAKKKS